MTSPILSQHQSRHRLIRNRRMTRILVTLKGQEKESEGNDVSGCPYEELDCVYLVVQRRPLNTLPWLIRWLLRAIYFRYRWAASEHEGGDYFSVEYQGVYTSQEDAYNAARADGFSYTALPLDICLPAETCHFRHHDFPTSEASSLYRQRPIDTVILTDQMLKTLDEGVGRVHQSATANQ